MEKTNVKKGSKDLQAIMIKMTSMTSRVPGLSDIVLKTIRNTAEEKIQIYKEILNLLKQYPDKSLKITGINKLQKVPSHGKGFYLEVDFVCIQCGTRNEITIWYTFGKKNKPPVHMFEEGIICESCLNQMAAEEQADKWGEGIEQDEERAGKHSYA